MRIFPPFLALLLTGSVVAGVLLMHRQAEDSTQKAIAEASRQVSGLQQEAETVISRSRAFLGLPCTPEVMQQLGRLAALSPHLRGVRLLSQGSTVCASLSGAPDLPASARVPAGEVQLLLRQGDALTPSEPVLNLVRRFDEGSVAISISGVFIRTVMQGREGRPALRFRVGGLEMDRYGHVRPFPEMHSAASGQASLFQFIADPDDTMWWVTPSGSTLRWGGLLLVGLMLLSFRWWRCGHDPVRRLLARALKRGDIRPWYQPVMDGRTGELTGCEVLARWHTSPDVVIPPDEFIPQAERNGLIVPMTRSLLQQVVRDLTPVCDVLPEGFHLSFNLSAAHAADGTLLSTCRSLQEALPGVILVAEITERERYEDSLPQPRLLQRLRESGVKVALDDFGTGYAGLSDLVRLPVDYLKLDRSFTVQTDAGMSGGGQALMAEMITDIALRLKMDVVAEGVETAAQRDWLIARGVNLHQGYLYARPLPVDDFIRLLIDSKTKNVHVEGEPDG